MVAIIYESQGGSSKRYAQWLSERLNLVCAPREELKDDTDEKIIYVGWRSGPMVSGLKDFPGRKNVIAVVCVGLEQYDEKAMDILKKKNGIDNLFYVRGGMDRSKLSFGQKLLLSAVSIKMLFFNRSPEDKEVRRVMDKGGDFSSPEQLDEVAEWYVSS
jgi:hypothetical protein